MQTHALTHARSLSISGLLAFPLVWWKVFVFAALYAVDHRVRDRVGRSDRPSSSRKRQII